MTYYGETRRKTAPNAYCPTCRVPPGTHCHDPRNSRPQYYRHTEFYTHAERGGCSVKRHTVDDVAVDVQTERGTATPRASVWLPHGPCIGLVYSIGRRYGFVRLNGDDAVTIPRPAYPNRALALQALLAAATV